MTETATLAAALATAALLYAIGWFAVRRLKLPWKITARVLLLALFFGPMAYVQFYQTAPKATAPRQSADAGSATPSPKRPAPTTAPPGATPPAPPAAAPAPGAGSPPPAAASPAPQKADRAVATSLPPAKNNELWDIVRVFYGTDRQRGPAGKRLTYTADRGARLDLGRADVTVPKSHQVPNIERPFAIRVPFTNMTLYEASEDPTKHFTIRELKGLTRDQFLDEVRARLAQSQTFKDRAVVFIHGYNTDFDFALYRAAQMTYDLKFDGAPFMYSWPSASGVAGYVYDRDSAEQAEPHLRAFLDLVIRETGAKNVSLIAHSMGNLPLLRVLRDIGPTLPDGVRLDQVILAAPDVDRTLFEQLASNITKVGRGITLYASSQDKAMSAARLVTGGVPRAGDVPAGGPVVMAGIDTIDVSATTLDSLSLGHSLYAERNTLVGDIAALLQTGLRPPDKRMPSLVRIETPKGTYWRVP